MGCCHKSSPAAGAAEKRPSFVRISNNSSFSPSISRSVDWPSVSIADYWFELFGIEYIAVGIHWISAMGFPKPSVMYSSRSSIGTSPHVMKAAAGKRHMGSRFLPGRFTSKR